MARGGMEIRKVCVLGAGTMGRGIAQVCAQMGGFEVNLRDVTDELLKEALTLIYKNLQNHFVRKGKITPEEAEAAWKRIRPTTDLRAAVQEADLVIEAITENLEAKKKSSRKAMVFLLRTPFSPPTPPRSALPFWLHSPRGPIALSEHTFHLLYPT